MKTQDPHCTSKPNSVSVTPWSPIYTLQSSCVLHASCLSTGIQSAHVLGSINKLQHTIRMFWCVSLYGAPTNAAQLHNVRQTNVSVSVAKNPSSRVLSHACLTEHPLSCVCFSEMVLQESALAFHTCIHFKETILPVFAPAQHHPTDFPKNP